MTAGDRLGVALGNHTSNPRKRPTLDTHTEDLCPPDVPKNSILVLVAIGHLTRYRISKTKLREMNKAIELREIVVKCSIIDNKSNQIRIKLRDNLYHGMHGSYLHISRG